MMGLLYMFPGMTAKAEQVRRAFLSYLVQELSDSTLCLLFHLAQSGNSMCCVVLVVIAQNQISKLFLKYQVGWKGHNGSKSWNIPSFSVLLHSPAALSPTDKRTLSGCLYKYCNRYFPFWGVNWIHMKFWKAGLSMLRVWIIGPTIEMALSKGLQQTGNLPLLRWEM
jgi:hypothetical protein